MQAYGIMHFENQFLKRLGNDYFILLHSEYFVIKRFSLHKMRKSFTHVNIVLKSAILVEK